VTFREPTKMAPFTVEQLGVTLREAGLVGRNIGLFVVPL
jgi:hypothetical protein